MAKEISEIIELLQNGEYQKAKQDLEELVLDHPKNHYILYNLGMCYSELGMIDESIRTLELAVKYQPDYSNAMVALGVSYTRKGDYKKAKEHLDNALEVDPGNPFALRNMGALYGKEQKYEEAVEVLKDAYSYLPDDPQVLYGLGLAYKGLGDLQKADLYIRELMELDIPIQFQQLAKDLLREIVNDEFNKTGIKLDAVFYCLAALQKFDKMTDEEVKKIVYEISMKGTQGYVINDFNRKYKLKSMPGEFTGLQLVSYLYVGFQRIAPEKDIGLNLSKEFEAALALFQKEKNG